MSVSKVKITRDNKWHLSALSAACMWFMFGKTSLALVFCFIHYMLIFFVGGVVMGIILLE